MGHTAKDTKPSVVGGGRGRGGGGRKRGWRSVERKGNRRSALQGQGRVIVNQPTPKLFQGDIYEIFRETEQSANGFS